MIGGVIKYFRFSYDYVVWGISWTNLNMLLAAMPSYDGGSDKEKPEGNEDTGFVDLEQFFKE